MSRMSSSCNWIEKNIQEISGLGGNAENIVKCIESILVSLMDGKEISLGTIASLSLNVYEYNGNINE